ncbi:MAG TPA: protein kinase [Polyangiaceae bacterium]|nr:protein kinase [Polyangiaceae bacterium]
MSGPLSPAPGGGDRGLVLGRYRVVTRLGQGGMSEVLLASTQSARGARKLCVIKRLRPDLSAAATGPALAGAALAGKAFASMFLQEAQITCRLNHPNIVHTYEVGEESGQLCIVMEYIEGESLHAVVRRLGRLGRQMPPALAARAMSEVLAGLHYAHELADLDGRPLNIVHRDVSPHNVVVAYQGGVKLLDFGIAKADASEIQTEVGVLKGKVHYMSPEHAQSKKIDRRADVFSAGVVLWEVLTSRRLVQGDTPVASWFSLLNDPFPRPSSLLGGLDPRLDAVVMRALERDPAARYPSALAMREALEAYLAASGEAAPADEVGRFVAELFAEERTARAAQIREFLGAASAASTGSNPAATPSLLEPGPVEGTPSQIAPIQPTVLPGTSSGALPAARPAPSRRRTLALGLLAAAALAGAFAFGRLGLQRVAETAPATPSPSAETAPAAPSPSAGAPPAGRDLAALSAPPPPAGAPPPKRERLEGARKGGKAGPRPGPRADASPAAAEAPAAASGFLTLDTYPWTRVSENGHVLGTTPLVRVPLAPGVHTLTLENAAENIKKTTTVTIKSGEDSSRRLAFQ